MPLDTTLRLLALARGLNAADIATAIPRAGVETVSAWLRGEKSPGRDQLDALARTFGVPVGALLSELASTFDPARTSGELAWIGSESELHASKDGKPLTLKEWYGDMRDKAPHWFPAQSGGGSQQP